MKGRTRWFRDRCDPPEFERAAICAVIMRGTAAFGDVNPDRLCGFIVRLMDKIKRAVEMGYRTFLYGFYTPCDKYILKSVIHIRLPGIEILPILVCPINSYNPFYGKYDMVVWEKPGEHYIANFRSSGSIFGRDKWMINNASLFIALWEGDRAVTNWGIVKYAGEAGVEVISLNPMCKD